MTRGFIVGVDVGGTTISVLVADADLKIIGRLSVPTNGSGSDAIVGRIADTIERALRDAGAQPTELAGIGLGVPGRVDTETGTVSLAVNLHWRSLPLSDELSSRLRAPVWVENDVRVAAAAIHELELAGKHDSLAFLSVGTGIAAGIILDGRPWRGVNGLAGEIGHIVVRPDGPECACGMRGCLEAVASGPSLARQAESALAARIPVVLTDHHRVSAVDVFAAAAAGDALMAPLANEAGDHLAWAIHLLVMAYDVEVVVLGGGVTLAGRDFMDPIRRGIDRRRAVSRLAREVLNQKNVVLLAAGAEPGPRGALLLARRRLALAS